MEVLIFMYKRFYDPLDTYFKKNKVLILYGARRIGKTTLLHHFLSQTQIKAKIITGDDIIIQHVLSSSDIEKIKQFCLGYDLIMIDEAQNIPNVGHALKIINDYIPETKIIATGSSSFDLANKVGEPLVGRQTVLTMFPLSIKELSQHYNPFELSQKLKEYLIFGFYPEVLMLDKKEDKIRYLRDLVGSYLYKDILSLYQIKNSETLLKLTKLLAFQVGSEISFNELSTQLGVDVKTIAKYINLLEKSFIIQKLSSYSGNLRSEVTRKSKYFFVDNGIRNAVISQFGNIDDRNDIGQLWENFLVMERFKKNTYEDRYVNMYFWRTYAKEEIDFVESYDHHLHAFEFKWNPKAKVKLKTFQNHYPNATLQIIHPENFIDFVV